MRNEVVDIANIFKLMVCLECGVIKVEIGKLLMQIFALIMKGDGGMSVNPEYYYNLSGNITDGKKEYSLHHKEDKIGGLSINSGLKENHIEYGTNSLLDLLNKLNNENKETKKENQYIKNTIKDMINTERTELGQSVLKQLWEQIQ